MMKVCPMLIYCLGPPNLFFIIMLEMDLVNISPLSLGTTLSLSIEYKRGTLQAGASLPGSDVLFFPSCSCGSGSSCCRTASGGDAQQASVVPSSGSFLDHWLLIEPSSILVGGFQVRCMCPSDNCPVNSTVPFAGSFHWRPVMILCPSALAPDCGPLVA